MLTDQELRQAVFALSIIEERGDPDEWAMILREKANTAPSGERWGNTLSGLAIGCDMLAGRLSSLLGESKHRCQEAAEDVWGNSRQRAILTALVSYAIELFGPARELTGESLFVPYTGEPEQTAKSPQRQTIRLVADERA
jgi:hypothetical protein